MSPSTKRPRWARCRGCDEALVPGARVMPILFQWGGEHLRNRGPLGGRSHAAGAYIILRRFANTSKLVDVETDRDIFTDQYRITIKAHAYKVCGDECAAAVEVRNALVAHDERSIDRRLLMLRHDVEDYAKMCRA